MAELTPNNAERVIPAKRIESDVHLKVTLKDNGISVAWDTVDIKQICMYAVEQMAFAGHCSFRIDSEDNTLLLVTYPASEQLYTGDHRIVARIVMDGDECTYDALALKLVSYTDSDGSVSLEDVEVGIEVEEVDTTIMHEILAACQAATDAALAAEAAIEAAEAARVEAESARVTAENARVEAESARVTAENARASAEVSRQEAEALRVSAETARANAEALRVTAENARVEAENARAAAETARQEAETARAAAEALRVSAENSRVSAESARVAAENSRVSAENARVSAENARVSAENSRQTAETARQEAEALRVAAENAREAACSQAITDLTNTVNALTLGLFSLIVEDGELKAVYNAEGSTFVGGGVSEDGEIYLEFNV